MLDVFHLKSVTALGTVERTEVIEIHSDSPFPMTHGTREVSEAKLRLFSSVCFAHVLLYACPQSPRRVLFKQYEGLQEYRTTPVRKRKRQRTDRDLPKRIKQAIQEGTTAALKDTTTALKEDIEAEFKGQINDRKRITEEEREAVALQGFEIDQLVAGYIDELSVIEVEDGFKIGFADGKTLTHAGRVFDMNELAILHELGSDTVAQRPHWVPVWQRFKVRYPEVAKAIRKAIQERLK